MDTLLLLGIVLIIIGIVFNRFKQHIFNQAESAR